MLIQNGADVNTKKLQTGELEIADWDPDYKVTEMTPLELPSKEAI